MGVPATNAPWPEDTSKMRHVMVGLCCLLAVGAPPCACGHLAGLLRRGRRKKLYASHRDHSSSGPQSRHGDHYHQCHDGDQWRHVVGEGAHGQSRPGRNFSPGSNHRHEQRSRHMEHPIRACAEGFHYRGRHPTRPRDCSPSAGATSRSWCDMTATGSRTSTLTSASANLTLYIMSGAQHSQWACCFKAVGCPVSKLRNPSASGGFWAGARRPPDDLL